MSAEGSILGHFLINEGCPLARFSFSPASLAFGGIHLRVYDRPRTSILFTLSNRLSVSVHRIDSGILIIFFLFSLRTGDFS